LLFHLAYYPLFLSKKRFKKMLRVVLNKVNCAYSNESSPKRSKGLVEVTENWNVDQTDECVSFVSPSTTAIDTTEDDLRALYCYTEAVEAKFQAIRDKDFARLDEQKCVYLDYTGAMLAPKTLIDEHAKLLYESILGNPHSENAPSLASAKLDAIARQEVLKFCKADPSEYEVIWTANASGGLRVVGECYPFTRKSAFLYAPDCHNSVLGITEFARKKKARFGGFKFLDASLCYDWSSFTKRMEQLTSKRGGATHKLLALPGESNASGYRHNVRRYVDHAHEHGWDVCVDLAAFAPANAIDLKALGNPEFITVSFYKIFGYPTGVGCLVAKRSALQKLQKPWFAGGTVRLVGVSSKTYVPFPYASDRHEQYEDGTINFQSTGAVTMGIRYMREVIGMRQLSSHVQFWSALLEMRLRKLVWDNGAPVVHMPRVTSADEERGHALAVVFLLKSGKILPHRLLERIVSSRGIAVRTGCFCNPGSSLQILDPYLDKYGATTEGFVNHVLRNLRSEERLHQVLERNAYQGYVRVSFGLATNRADIEALLACIEQDILARPNELEMEAKDLKDSGPVPYSLC
jgi:molybdenum cofactor sulfurtransferase